MKHLVKIKLTTQPSLVWFKGIIVRLVGHYPTPKIPLLLSLFYVPFFLYILPYSLFPIPHSLALIYRPMYLLSLSRSLLSIYLTPLSFLLAFFSFLSHFSPDPSPFYIFSLSTVFLPFSFYPSLPVFPFLSSSRLTSLYMLYLSSLSLYIYSPIYLFRSLPFL